VAEQFIGPVIVEGTPGKVYAACVGIIARNDCDIGDGGGENWRVESNQNNDEGE